MNLVDTPNPNAKKIAQLLFEVNGVDSIFTGPGFLTITKKEDADWETINNDILNKFDTI